jgi:phosphoribosylformylglycinamidine synthase
MLLPDGKALAIASDCNSNYCHLDPYMGGAGAVAESCRNVAATGAQPLAIVDCCNFGDPERPENFYQFKESIKGMADMCLGLGVPCIGGNVSFYNESSTGKAVKPSPTVVAIGLLEELRPKSKVTLGFQRPGDQIIIVGETFPELGGSEYNRLRGARGGRPPVADPRRERRSIDAVLAAIKTGSVGSCHDCSKGGIGVALSVMAMKGLGATVELENISRSLTMEELLFSESHSRFIITTKEPLALNVPSTRIGVVGGKSLKLRWRGRELDLPIEVMRKAWEGTIPKHMEGP